MIREKYESRREALERELGACEDVKAAADCLGRTLERLRIEARAEADTPALRRETDRLFEAAKQAALLMMSVTEVDISAVSRPVSKRDRLAQALPWASAGAGLLLAGWMLLIGQSAAAVLGLISAGLGLGQAWLRRDGDTAGFRARTRVNVYDLMRMTDRLTQAMDDSLTQAGQEQATLPGAGRAELTGDMLTPVQMLMEAVYTKDGDYALKAAPQLISALNEQGVELVEYAPEHRDWFELFPGTEDGLTIRPALVKEGKLLARGQATEVA
ncbi:MAG: hypothetical protein IKP72_03865 [Clostridia bacterium]|nr:hypothetical protein [Clostridia bacterium]